MTAIEDEIFRILTDIYGQNPIQHKSYADVIAPYVSFKLKELGENIRVNLEVDMKHDLMFPSVPKWHGLESMNKTINAALARTLGKEEG